ncbi:MAG TPA: MFS transporter, partial [Gemmatimonadales bacterium]|nr:MFS transporter [Gemmatimonadales bacterium]
MPAPTPDNPVRDKTKLIVFCLVFVDLIGFGIVMPLLPSYGARYTDNEALIGLLVSATPAMQLLAAPFWGRLSDRIGRRPVMLMSLAGAAVSYLLFTLAGSYTALLVSRVVAGSIDASVGVGQAFLADRTRPEERAKAMGLIGAAYGMGFIVGPAIAGISSLIDPGLPGIVATVITGANLLVALVILPRGTARRLDGAATELPHKATGRARLAPLLVAFLATLGFTVLYVLLALFAERDLGYDRPRVSGLFVVLGIVTAIVQGGVVGRLAQRMGERSLIVLGAVILSLGLGTLTGASHLTLGPTGAAVMVVLSLVIVGTGWGLVGPGVAGYVSRHSPADAQGRSLGVLHGVGSAARIVGPPLFGVLASVGSFVPPF